MNLKCEYVSTNRSLESLQKKLNLRKFFKIINAALFISSGFVFSKINNCSHCDVVSRFLLAKRLETRAEPSKNVLDSKAKLSFEGLRSLKWKNVEHIMRLTMTVGMLSLCQCKSAV